MNSWTALSANETMVENNRLLTVETLGNLRRRQKALFFLSLL